MYNFLQLELPNILISYLGFIDLFYSCTWKWKIKSIVLSRKQDPLNRFVQSQKSIRFQLFSFFFFFLFSFANRKIYSSFHLKQAYRFPMHFMLLLFPKPREKNQMIKKLKLFNWIELSWTVFAIVIIWGISWVNPISILIKSDTQTPTHTHT